MGRKETGFRGRVQNERRGIGDRRGCERVGDQRRVIKRGRERKEGKSRRRGERWG